jgi:hypothetical protein
MWPDASTTSMLDRFADDAAVPTIVTGMKKLF